MHRMICHGLDPLPEGARQPFPWAEKDFLAAIPIDSEQAKRPFNIQSVERPN
jgi:hypothetical protein